MCIGIPMQVIAVEPGYAVCSGRGETRRVRTALVGHFEQHEWLLVFIDSAQEVITAERAHEINATLDLMQASLAGEAIPEAAFALPSAMSREQLLALSAP